MRLNELGVERGLVETGLLASQVRQRRWMYGLAPQDWYDLIDRQGGLCAVSGCDQVPSKISEVHCVNHNQGIGKLGDTPEGVLAALIYLFRYDVHTRRLEEPGGFVSY